MRVGVDLAIEAVGTFSPTADRRDDVGVLFAPLQAALADLSANYNDDQLDVITGFLAALGYILDDQIERLRATEAPAATTG